MRFSPSDLRGLMVFRAIIENNGFVGANLATGMKQSTLSFHLKGLEERVGFELCRRGRGGLRLTERGQEVYEASKSLLMAISSFEGRLGDMRNELSGTLRVGIVANTVSDADLPIDAVMNACLEKAPSANVQLLIAHPEALADELCRDGIDIALSPPTGLGSNFHKKLFYYEMHSLYCSDLHPLFHVPAEALTQVRLMEHDFCIRSYGNKSEIKPYPSARVRVQASTMEAQSILILSGQVIGFLPEHFARQWEINGRMRRLNNEEGRYASPFMIMSKAAQKQTPLQRMFIRELRKRCRRDPAILSEGSEGAID